ncbi:MAG: aminoglycoside phosphotransferase [Cellvibrionaceae bacterium]|nr:aminoglycoside phosphotransferase [Cellvibrionaceae bacterium]|tara:strand:+ start:451 stop:1863 length:1413 start_codon:yes stop_codon:yes gene_type:complete
MAAEMAFELALQQLLERVMPDYQSLTECRQLTAGASQETYRITYQSEQGEVCMALRRAQPTAATDSTVGGISLESEARLFELAVMHDIPSPQVIYLLTPSDQLGSGFLMNWLEGETLGHRINRSQELDDVRPQLARQCGEILGKIHQIDWQAQALDKMLERITTEDLVNDTWQRYRDLNVPVPMIDFTWRWLLQNLPIQQRTTLVHSDFRNGNLIVNPQGIHAVLDWELAHIGDPIQDLGWLCVNSWRFGNRDAEVGGFGQAEELFAGYKSVTGIDVDPNDFTFWQVFGSFWWSITTLAMANTWRTGEAPSLERPVIGRRSSEAQMDCVNLIIPGSFEVPQEQALDQGTQLPMPAELLSGVAGFLKNDVSSQLDSHAGFLAKVAANSLTIARRELQYGSTLTTAEEKRLRSLLGSDEIFDACIDQLRWLLVERLRQGLSLHTEGLVEHLRYTVAGQLFIDQPRYSALSAS